MLALLLMCPLTLLMAQSHSKSHHIRDNSLNAYKLKYLTPYTNYPVKLIDHFGTYETTNAVVSTTRWFKYGTSKYIDTLNNETLLDGHYFATEVNDVNGAVNLYLLDYDRKNNFLLDHYEPRHQHFEAIHGKNGDGAGGVDQDLVKRIKQHLAASKSGKVGKGLSL